MPNLPQSQPEGSHSGPLGWLCHLEPRSTSLSSSLSSVLLHTTATPEMFQKCSCHSLFNFISVSRAFWGEAQTLQCHLQGRPYWPLLFAQSHLQPSPNTPGDWPHCTYTHPKSLLLLSTGSFAMTILSECPTSGPPWQLLAFVQVEISV